MLLSDGGPLGVLSILARRNLPELYFFLDLEPAEWDLDGFK